MAEDWAEFGKLERDLGTPPQEVKRTIPTALGVTSGRIKRGWAGRVSGSPGLGGLAGAVTYDVTSSGTTFESEIGYDKSRSQGPLGNISEYGSPKHPARGYGLASLQEEAPDFERGMDKAIDDALKAAGL